MFQCLGRLPLTGLMLTFSSLLPIAGFAAPSSLGVNPFDPSTYSKIALDPSAIKPATNLVTIPKQQINRKLCVWDIMGDNGEIVALLKDYKVKAKTLGINFTIVSYTDEKVAAEDFRVKHCDAVVLTGLRARMFNPFTGSIEAVAGLQNDAQMKVLVKALSSPQRAEDMLRTFDEERYEVVGVMPFGAAFAFVNDKKINNAEQVAGKRIAIFDYDKAQDQLVAELGGISIPSDVTNFGAKFNSGSVDIAFTPLLAYSALELYKGMNQKGVAKGGIMRYPLAYVSLQIITHANLFPVNFGQESRNFIYSEFNRYLRLINRYETQVDGKYWVEISPADKQRYDLMSRTSRIAVANKGIYNRQMLSLMRKIRCAQVSMHPECSMGAE